MRTIYFILLFSLCLSAVYAQDFNGKDGYFEFNSAIGFRGISETKNTFKKVYFSAGYSTKVHPVFDTKLLLESFYSERIDVYQGLAEASDKWSIGLQLAGDLYFDKLILTFGLGKYLYFQSPHGVWMYSSLGFRYRLTKHLNLLWIFKAHRNEADFMNFGLGYRF